MAVSTTRTLQAGGTIWDLVAKANPKASDARVAKMTNAVLKDNDMTATEARSLQAGAKIDLSEALPPPKPAAKPATPATPAAPSPMTVYVPSNLFNMTPDQYTQLQQSLGQQNGLLQALQQQMAQTNMPTSSMPTSGSSGGLDAFLKGQIKNSGSSQQLASSAGQLSFGLSGQQFLPFANPNVILGNLGLMG